MLHNQFPSLYVANAKKCIRIHQLHITHAMFVSLPRPMAEPLVSAANYPHLCSEPESNQRHADFQSAHLPMVLDANRGLLSCFGRSLPIVCQVIQHRSRKDRGGSWTARKSSGSPPQPCLARPTLHSTAHKVSFVEKSVQFFRRPRENVAEVGRAPSRLIPHLPE